jgi:hypothetical protein
MRYFIEAQNVEELRRALEELDLNIDEVDYREA